MTAAMPTAAGMFAQMRDLAATLPTRCPTTLRVGPGVLDVLRRAAQPSGWLTTHQFSLGMRVVEDDTFPPGAWKVFDQWDMELSDGVIVVPGATVTVKLDDGTSKQMRVLTVDGDTYTVAVPALIDGFPFSTRWYW